MTQDLLRIRRRAPGGRRLVLSTLRAVLTGGMLLAGLTCARQPPAEPLVTGYLFKEAWASGSVTWDRYAEVFDYSFLPEIPKVRLNGQELDLTGYQGIDATYESSSEFPIDTTYDLDVSHYWGNASTRVDMPGDFTVTWPDSTYVLGIDSLLTVTWRKARGATSYLVDLSLEYEYYDWQNTYQDTEYDVDTVVHDTFCQFERNYFFPSHVQYVLDGSAEAVIWACDGPQALPGSKGNVQGAGYGFFTTVNQAPEVDFIVVQPDLKRLDWPEPIDQTRERLIRKLRQMTGIPESIPGAPRVRP
jgi:hypothetical protein